jgi:hypothetical protein
LNSIMFSSDKQCRCPSVVEFSRVDKTPSASASHPSTRELCLVSVIGRSTF